LKSTLQWSSCQIWLTAFLAGIALASGGELHSKPVFEIRMETPLSSIQSVVGSAVRGAVVSPAIVDGQVYLPVGAKINGRVIRRSKVGFGLRHERALLGILFSEVELPDGSKFPIETSLISVDNAREDVTREGYIRGILAADSLPTYIFGVWHWPTSVLPHRALMGLTGASGMTWVRVAPNPIGAAAFLGLRYALVPWPNPEIQLPAGAELRLRLDWIDDSAPTSVAGEASPLDKGLGERLESTAFQITKLGGTSPGDIINLAFVGTHAQVTNAFETAGWVTADSLDRRSFMDTYRAYTTGQGYATAPVSELKHQGLSPALVFQKALNTITKRHHIRIWAAEDFGDQTLWIAAASHDVGLEFDGARLKFTHRIDERLDLERTKVMNDLAYVGCLDSVSYVRRPAVETHTNGSEKTQTDGRMAVGFIGSCSSPADAPVERLFDSRKPRLLYRLGQRTILETRNYLFRRNAYYQVYWLARKTRVFARRTRPAPTLVNSALEANLPAARSPNILTTEVGLAHGTAFLDAQPE